MKFIGAIAFLDSTREDRQTKVMSFMIGADWFNSVRSYFLHETNAGNYDGTEILVNLYEYKGDAEVFAEGEIDYDSSLLIESSSIKNPYYV